jgi:hypothetical protein
MTPAEQKPKPELPQKADWQKSLALVLIQL